MNSHEKLFYSYFTYLSQLCFDKAKEHLDKQKELMKSKTAWSDLLLALPQITLAEKSYMELGFFQNKTKGFLWKDNSLISVYVGIHTEINKLKESNEDEFNKFCENILQYLQARIQLIEFYEKIHSCGTTNMETYTYSELVQEIRTIIANNMHLFVDITLSSVKSSFNLECEILDDLFNALKEMQNMQFSEPLFHINGAKTRLMIWEQIIENRDTWKLGFFKSSQLPLLMQWHKKFKAAVLGKFTLLFYDILVEQTTPSDMMKQCSKLQNDYFSRIVTFQKKYDAKNIVILFDNVSEGDDNQRVIFSLPPKTQMKGDLLGKLLADSEWIQSKENITYKFVTNPENSSSYAVTVLEKKMYMVILFGSKKSAKDIYIINFISDLCLNLRCSKVFVALKCLQ